MHRLRIENELRPATLWLGSRGVISGCKVSGVASPNLRSGLSPDVAEKTLPNFLYESHITTKENHDANDTWMDNACFWN